MADEVVEIHAIISGSVQGVGFRFASERIAEMFKISGTVQNLPDGTVEIYAQGAREQLDQFIEQLKNGAGLVEDISIEVSQPSRELKGFRIIY